MDTASATLLSTSPFEQAQESTRSNIREGKGTNLENGPLKREKFKARKADPND